MKKHLVISILVFVFLAGQAWGVTLYWGTSGGTGYRNTTGCPVAAGDTASTLQATITASGASGVINICAGTYSGTLLRDPAAPMVFTSNDQTIQSETRNKADVILDGTGFGNHIFNLATNTGGTVRDLTIQNTDTDKYAFDVQVAATISDVDILNCSRGMYIRTNAGGTYNRLRFYRTTHANYMVAVAGTAAASTWNNCIFENNSGTIALLAAVTINFNNCIFTGSKDTVINNGNFASIITAKNCIFAGNNLDGANNVVFYSTNNGTWNFTNCIVAPRMGYSAASVWFQGTPAELNNTDNSDKYYPMWKTPQREGRLFLFIDDTANLANWKTLANMADTYGFKVCLAFYRAGADAVDFEALAGYINRGHEVASHGWSGARVATTNAFTANKAGSSIVIAATRTDANDSSTWSGTLTLDAETPIDLASSSYDTVDEVIAYLVANGVTIGSAANQNTYNAVDYKPNSLALAAGTYNVNSTQTLLFHEGSLLVTEMLDSKTWIESKITPYIPTWTAKSFVYSAGANSANSKAYALGTAGYSQARTLSSNISAAAQLGVAAIDMATVASSDADIVLGDTSDDIRNHLYNYLTGLEQIGGVGGIHAHTFTGFTQAQWGYLLGHLAAYVGAVTVDTFSGAMDWVRANDDHVTGTVSYKCSTGTDSCWPRNANYNLRAGSPAIDAGTPVFTAAEWLSGGDAAGNHYVFGAGPDIGAYERKKYLFDDDDDVIPKKCNSTNAACYIQP